jgi:hypothetical protein
VTVDANPSQPMQLGVARTVGCSTSSGLGNSRSSARDGTISTAGTLNVYTGGEDGLIGIAIDPAFATNNRVYLNRSPAGSVEVNRVSRFTMKGTHSTRTAK